MPPSSPARERAAEPESRRRPLTLALPKGRLLEAIVPLCTAAGLSGVRHLTGDEAQRHLWWDDAETGIRLLLARPRDVWTYVAHGGADLGITGKDVLVEATAGEGFLVGSLDGLRADPGTAPPPVVELLDLRTGTCHMAVAGPAEGAHQWPERRRRPGRLRVGTKYPACARLHLGSGPAELELIPLAGSVELAPLVGLADVIVDLVATGRTLAAHGLVEYERLFESTARLIANEASLRLREPEIAPLVARLEQAAPPAGQAATAGAATGGAGGGETR